MRNIAEQTAEAATNAKVCLSGNWVTLVTSYRPKCKLSMDIAIQRKFYEVNSNPAFP
jgi:hypothetical protein